MIDNLISLVYKKFKKMINLIKFFENKYKGIEIIIVIIFLKRK